MLRMRGSVSDIFTVNLETKEIVNLTKDAFANYAPTWAPDGKSLVYLVRVSGNEKIFRMNADGSPDVLVISGNLNRQPAGWHVEPDAVRQELHNG